MCIMESEKNLWHVLLSLFISILILKISGLTYAQEQKEHEEKGEDTFTLEDIVVTATKTGETNIQKTGLAISAFDQEKLDDASIVDTWDLDLVAPGMTVFKDTRNAALWIRNVGSISYLAGGHDAVAIYVDDLYTARYTGLYSTLMDTELVEVLRGPQGTLYGRNTAGGAVRIQTAMPTDEMSGFMTLEYGSQNKHGFTGALSGPIIENKLKARFAFLKISRDGYFEDRGPGTPDTIDDEDRTSARAKLQFNPSDNVDLILSGEYHEIDNKGGIYVSHKNPTPFVAAGAQPYEPFEYTATNLSPIGLDRGVNQKTQRVGITGHFNLSQDITLKSITVYNHHDWRTSTDYDGTTLPVYEINDMRQFFRAFTQEFQLNGTWKNLTMVGDLFYLYEKEWTNIYAYLDRGAPVTGIRDFGPRGNSYAIYVSGTYAVSKKLSLTAGARYSLDERDWYVDNRINVGGFQLIPFKEELHNSWSDVSPKLGIDYRITDDAFAYASITKGYKAGGWNGLSTTRSAFDPEYIWAYEVGAKTDWLKKRFRANLALFYYDYQDMQAFAFSPDPGAAVSITIRNATDSEVYGGELELMARPLPSLSMGTTVSLARGVYGSYPTEDLYGNRIDRGGEKFDTPEWSVNAFVSYIIPLKNRGFVNFNANYVWRSAWYDDGVDSEILRIDHRSILNARIMFETTNGKWFLDLYGRNLTDKRYWIGFLNDSGIGPATPENPLGTVASDARNFGIRLGYRF